MPLNIPWFTESMKKRAVRYLLNRYLGHFLEEKLDLQHLTVDIFDGKGSISSISLDTICLNEELAFLPLKFLDGCRINKVSVSVPWSSLLSESSCMVIDGISIYCVLDCDYQKKLAESSCLSKSLMTSSMQIAEEIASEGEKVECLEIFAQLIDSVLRRVKITMTNTTLVVMESNAAEDKADISSVQFKVGLITCEEQSPTTSDQSDDTDFMQPSDTISKLLTLEGVELYIAGCCVSRLTGKHTLKVNANESKVDLLINIGSMILGVLNAEQLAVLLKVFSTCSSYKPARGFVSENLMNASDFAKVEQQLQLNAVKAFNAAVAQRPNHANLVTRDIWTCSPDSPENTNDAQFLPLTNVKHTCNESDQQNCSFTCVVKLPGVVICLLRSSEVISSAVPAGNLTHDSIDAHLQKHIKNKFHIRLFALSLQLDISDDAISFFWKEMTITEHHERGSNHILFTEKEETSSNSPRYQCEICGDRINLTCNTCISVTVDPTFLERLGEYIEMSESGDSSKCLFTLVCERVKAKVLIPIPDLGSESKNTRVSSVRREWFNVDVSKLKFVSADMKSVEATCDRVTADLVVDDDIFRIAEGCGNKRGPVKVAFKNGPTATLSTNLEETINNTLMQAAMEESIYISNANSHDHNGPFQTKRKVIKQKEDDVEHVISPNDRKASESFLEAARAATQMQFDISVPFANLTFAEKHILELVYNRFGNDLVLWQATLDLSRGKVPRNGPSSPTQPTYYTCKAGGLTESVDSESSFHSLTGSPTHRMHNLAVCILKSEKLIFEMGEATHRQDISGENVLLGYVCNLDSLSNVMTLSSENVSFSHNSEVVVGGNKSVQTNSSLNMAMEIVEKSENLKKVKFAIQIINGLMMDTDVEKFKAMWSFVDVKNETIPGYYSPSLLTEVHIDLVNGAVLVETEKTRPALLAFDDAYITSMVDENSAHTILRFIVEEGSFSIRKNKKSSLSLENYVCVVDSGLLDLSVKVGNASDKLEFKLSNNIINVRVCSDSLAALCEILQSFVHSGDNSQVPSQTAPHDGNKIIKNATCPPNVIQDVFDESDEELKSLNEKISTKACECNNGSDELDESTFWVLGDDDLGTGINNTAEPQIRVLTSEPVRIIENYFGKAKARPIPDVSEKNLARYLLNEMSVVVNLYGGRDFEDSNEASDDENPIEIKENHFSAGEPRVKFINDNVHLWESLDLMTAPGTSQQKLVTTSAGNSKTAGGRHRQNDLCVQFSFSKIKILFDKFVPSFPVAWRFIFMVNNIEVRDRVSASKINKMLYEYSSEALPRRTSANMVHLRAKSCRNDTDDYEECDIKLSVKPLRINIDQDTIMFLVEFINRFITLLMLLDETTPTTSSSRSATPEEAVPEAGLGASEKLVNDDSGSSPLPNSKPTELYIKSFTFSPQVPIKLDYHGKRVDFEQGALQGLLMGLAQLNQSELCLKRLNNQHGYLGLDRVIAYAVSEWATDIKRNQLPSLLGGVGPIRSFIQLFQGVKDLVWMPVDQYRRDRRLVRGLQRGASSFSSSTAMAVIDLANRFVNIIQGTAQFAHDVVSPPVQFHNHTNRAVIPSSQPRDLREGMVTALAVMREGLNETVWNVASAGMQADDLSQAVGGVIRQIPSTIFRPIIQASQATSNVLVGIRNQLTPEARKEDQDKWKTT